MTVVVALVTPKRAYMGADSNASDGDTAVSNGLSKVARVDGMLLGYAGSLAPGQWFFDYARKNPGSSLREMFEAAPRSLVRNEARFSLLAVSGARIFEANGEGGLIRMRPRDGYSYAAIGTGAAVALGALYGWHHERDALVHALHAAGKHAPDVRGPYRIVSL